jgi:tRNA pseudouridine38-40 synthase
VPEDLRRGDVPGHTRTLRRVELRETRDTLEIELEGDAFLYRMVRLIVGALLQVARQRAALDWFTDLLASPHGPQCQSMAPAGGLYLVKVLYEQPLESGAEGSITKPNNHDQLH